MIEPRSLEAWLAQAFALLFVAAFLALWAPSPWARAGAQAGLCLIGIAWLTAVEPARRPVRLHPMLAPLAGASLWGWLQIAAGRTIDRWVTEQAVLDWLMRLVACFLALQLYQDFRRRRRLLGGLLWFGFLLSVVASLQRFTSPGRIFWLFKTDAPGAMGPFVYHNQYAAFLETAFPLALVAALQERERAWRYRLMAAAMLASVIAAGSRAGTLLLAGELVVIPALWRQRSSRRQSGVRRTAAWTAALAAALVLAMGASPLAEKLGRSDPWGERRELTLSTIEMARERPVMGFGLGTWSLAYPAYARFDDGLFDNQAHNDWAQWAAEGGAPFLALLVAFAVSLAPAALRSVWGAGLLAVLAHCLVDYHFHERPAFGYFFFALAGVAALDSAAERRP